MPRKPFTSSLGVNPAAPQCLVGIDVPDPRHDGLVQQGPFHPTTPPPESRDGVLDVKFRIEGIASDMRDLGRQLGPFEAEMDTPEGSLVDETHLPFVVQVEAHAGVTIIGGFIVDAELPTHAEMDDKGVPIGERQPQILATTTWFGEGAPFERHLKIVDTRRVTPYRPRVENLDTRQTPTTEMGRQAATYDLDLG